MRRRRLTGKEKERYGLAAALVLAVFLSFAGCGGRAVDSPAGDGPQTASPFPISPLPSGETQDTPAIETAPLLTFEDPETQNLAGLLQEQCGGMMVQLRAGGLLGSGVLYGLEEGQLLILTAAHVLEEASGTVLVTFSDGWEYESGDFMRSVQSDLAVVRVPSAQIPESRLSSYCLANCDKEVYDSVGQGDGCIVMGSRSGVAEDAYEGQILEPWIYMEDYGQYMSWVSAAGEPGMSGGGLFDRRGHFLGILSGRSGDGQWAVVPLALILAEIENLSY